jgi:hypothetical protein
MGDETKMLAGTMQTDPRSGHIKSKGDDLLFAVSRIAVVAKYSSDTLIIMKCKHQALTVNNFSYFRTKKAQESIHCQSLLKVSRESLIRANCCSKTY